MLLLLLLFCFFVRSYGIAIIRSLNIEYIISRKAATEKAIRHKMEIETEMENSY